MTSAPVTTPVWCDSHRAQLVEQAKHWMAAEVLVLPVIPVELDAEKFPKRRPNKAKLDERGNPTWEVIIDKEGNIARFLFAGVNEAQLSQIIDGLL